ARTAIERDDASVMHHFQKDHDIPDSLHDLIIVVVAGWKHGRICPHDATIGQGSVFGTIGGMQGSSFWPGRRLLLCFRSQWRNSSIGRVHNDRGPPGRYDRCPSIPPKIIVANREVRLRIAVAAVAVSSFTRLLFVFDSFLRREELFVSQFWWTLQWR